MDEKDNIRGFVQDYCKRAQRQVFNSSYASTSGTLRAGRRQTPDEHLPFAALAELDAVPSVVVNLSGSRTKVPSVS